MRYSGPGMLLALLILSGCDGQPPSPDPLTRGIDEQMKAQEKGDSVSHRTQVRHAAISHVKKYYSEWTIQGVSIYSNTGTVYLVGVDATSSENRQTIEVSVEMFVKDSGERYWKTSFAPPGVGAKPLEFIVEVYKSPKD